MDIEKELKYEKERIEKLIQEIQKRIPEYKMHAGNKKLNCTRSHGKTQYLIDGKYTSKKELALAESIANHKYSEELLKYASKELEAIDELLAYILDNELDNVYEKLCEGRKKLITPYYETKKEYIDKWMKVQYEPYGRWDEVKTELYTAKGERVRSKSELIIANELLGYGVPYRYEFPIEILDGNKTRTFHPDFIALNKRTCKEIILEHLGMMDKLDYNNSNLRKIDLMERNGYILGKNFIILHETSDNGLNIKVVRNYIEEYLT